MSDAALHHVLSIAGGSAAPFDIVATALETARRHLGMEVAYLSEFVGEDTVFRAVSAPGLEALIAPGDSRPLSEVYCRHILADRLPRLIRDTADEALAMAMPITAALPIGSHVSVPVRRSDGSVYGMFCCLSPRPSPTLTHRDLDVVELFASIASDQVNATLTDRARVDRIRVDLRGAMRDGGLEMAFQPIRDLSTSLIVGYEALARFASVPYRSPDRWFADAAELGLAEGLECAAIARALPALDRLPAPLFVSVNAGPDTVASGALAEALRGRDLSRIVLEVTEQQVVADYARIARALGPLRAAGLRLAVDDAGAGYAGLQQILALSPDKIKLDMSLTRDVDRDHARASLADALVGFARKTGATLIAEGIETPAEHAALRALGVQEGQGYHLGRPMPLDQAVADHAVRPCGEDRLAG